MIIKYTQQLISLFLILSTVLLIATAILYTQLPATISIPFNFILTTPISFGSKAYIFTLPAMVFLTSGSWRYFSHSYSTLVHFGFFLLNTVTLFASCYYLLLLILT